MRGPSRLFQGYLPFSRSTKTAMPEPVTSAPITSDFTPGQTLAMLTMRRSELSLAVLAKLGNSNSTARATIEDYTDLATLGYARRMGDGFHKLSPRGHFKANDLARALAEQLGIPIPKVTQSRRRGAYQPGILSQNGNW